MSRTRAHAPVAVQRARLLGVEPPKEKIFSWNYDLPSDHENFVLGTQDFWTEHSIRYRRGTFNRKIRRLTEKSTRARVRRGLRELIRNIESDAGEAAICEPHRAW